jgi:hypothetical protein
VRAALEEALAALGAPARAVATAPRSVTAYADARVLAEAARAVHARLLA